MFVSFHVMNLSTILSANTILGSQAAATAVARTNKEKRRNTNKNKGNLCQKFVYSFLDCCVHPCCHRVHHPLDHSMKDDEDEAVNEQFDRLLEQGVHAWEWIHRQECRHRD